LKNLKYLDCSFNLLEELNVEGCESLEILDADLNLLEDLCFP